MNSGIWLDIWQRSRIPGIKTRLESGSVKEGGESLRSLTYLKEVSMKKLYRIYVSCLTLMLMLTALTVPALAVDDMWTVANTVIVDVYSKIAGISTVLANSPTTSTKLTRRGTGSNASGLPGQSSTALARSSPMLLPCLMALQR